MCMYCNTVIAVAFSYCICETIHNPRQNMMLSMRWRFVNAVIA